MRSQSAARIITGPKRVSRPITLVLDMDETLLHSEVARRYSPMKTIDPVITQNEPTGMHHTVRWPDGFAMSVVLRPGVHEFLEFTAKHFEVILWTAGTEEYVKQALKLLDPSKSIFSYVVSRDDSWFSHGDYVKDLRQLGRSLSQTIIVDNTAAVCRPNFPNSIIISNFEEMTSTDRSDTDLSVVQKALTPLIDSDIEDVRKHITTTNLLHTMKFYGSTAYCTRQVVAL